MGIKKIKVVNFKSFENIEVELGKFNVLIGANASGKSNFVNIFKFLKDIAKHGLDNAISLQGEVKYLRNIRIGTLEDMFLKVVFDHKFGLAVPTKNGLIGVKNYETTYEFALSFYKRRVKRRVGFNIKQDRLNQKLKFVVLEKQVKGFKEKEVIGTGEVLISRSNGKVKIDLVKPQDVPIKEDDLFPPFLKEIELPFNALLLETPIFLFPIREIFNNIAIYDFDPKLPKKATPITGRAELEEDGSNLAIVLKNILTDDEKKRKFLNLIKDLLPFVENLDVEKFADKSLLFKLREKYFENEYLPASLISDGTINITALIIALYFEKKPLIIVEEPERNIHPYLIAKVVEMMKDASQQKQIIITTHNPEIVKHAGIENLLLISRDENGFSRITRPLDKNTVKTFLKNDIGIEELYVQNLLEI